MRRTVKLGDVCTIYNGGTPKSNVKSYWEGDIQWLTPKDMGKLTGKYVGETERKITDSGIQNSSAKLVPPQSVILSCRAPIGHVFINEVDMSFNQGCKGLVPTDEITVEYLYYFIFSSKKLLNDLGTGTTFKEISGKTLSSVSIPLPPLAEQQRIVAKLDAAFSAIDKAIIAVHKQLSDVEVMYSTILTHCFDGSSAPRKPLSELCKITSSKRVMKKDYVDNGVPFFRTKEIKQLANNESVTTELFISREQFESLRENFGAPSKGEILITAIGTIGEVYVVREGDEFYFKDGNVLWLKEIRDANQEYLRFGLMSFVEKLNSLAHGAAYSALPIQRLKAFELPIPATEVQKQIVRRLEQSGEFRAKLHESLSLKLSKLNYLKSAILTQELQPPKSKAA